MPEFTKRRNEVNVDLLKLTVGRIVLSSSINIVKKSILFNVQVRHAFFGHVFFISITIFHKQVKYFLLYQKKIYIENFNIKA